MIGLEALMRANNPQTKTNDICVSQRASERKAIREALKSQDFEMARQLEKFESNLANASALKAIPVDADEVGIWDSEAKAREVEDLQARNQYLERLVFRFKARLAQVAQASDARYSQGYSDGWKEGREEPLIIPTHALAGVDKVLDKAVNAFVETMKNRLLEKSALGWWGWDSPNSALGTKLLTNAAKGVVKGDSESKPCGRAAVTPM